MALLLPAFVGVSTDGVTITKWTDEGREAIEEQRDERSTVVNLASGNNRKFIKAIKKKWVVNYTNAPQNAAHALDGAWGRDEIRNFIYSTNISGGTFYWYLDDGINAVETYTVFLDNYDDQYMIRRANHNSRFNITINLSEF